MSNNKQFTITLSERQLKLLAYACRVTDRLIIGQLDFSLQECCEAAFEKLHKNDEAGKMCEGMVSPDYRERFKAEYIQLKNRYGGLRRMLDEWKDGKLRSIPSCSRSLLEDQAAYMANYLMALTERAAIEEIELDD